MRENTDDAGTKWLPRSTGNKAKLKAVVFNGFPVVSKPLGHMEVKAGNDHVTHYWWNQTHRDITETAKDSLSV